METSYTINTVKSLRYRMGTVNAILSIAQYSNFKKQTNNKEQWKKPQFRVFTDRHPKQLTNEHGKAMENFDMVTVTYIWLF